MSQAPNTEPLDAHLGECVNALHRAVKLGMAHLGDSRKVDEAIRDCKEILDAVTEGNVSEWLR